LEIIYGTYVLGDGRRSRVVRMNNDKLACKKDESNIKTDQGKADNINQHITALINVMI